MNDYPEPDTFLEEVLKDFEVLVEQGYIDVLQRDEEGIPLIFVMTPKALEFEDDGQDYGVLPPRM